MKAMILAAGLGTRLKPFSNYLPKPLLPFINRPLIEHTIEFLGKYGITELIINVHHLGEKIIDYLGDGKRFGVTVTYSKEEEILGTGGGIKRVKEFLKDEVFVVINSDFLIDFDLKEAIDFHQQNKALATMILREAQEMKAYGTIGISKEGYLTKFTNIIESTAETVLKEGHFVGIHILSPPIFEYLEDLSREVFCINREIYPRLIRDNKKVLGYFMDGVWIDLGTIKNYSKAQLEALQQSDFYRFETTEKIQIGAGTTIADTAFLKGPVVIGEHNIIKEEVDILPGTIIGSKCTVENRAQLAESIVLDGSHIQAGANFKRKIIFKDLVLEI